MAVEQSTPVVLELMTYRMSHHTTSDDSSLYRPEGEIDQWSAAAAAAAAVFPTAATAVFPPPPLPPCVSPPYQQRPQKQPRARS